jgi:MOSC domain-containing protein YiiM
MVGYRADMAQARVISVNRGQPADMVIGGKPGRTGIDKRPVAGPVKVTASGLDGDDVADKENHGGADQAVYAYAREDLDWWAEQLGRGLSDGIFGENVTICGLDITGALIGETWRLGTAVVQVTAPRVPCVTFESWLGEDHWVRRFAAGGRPGAYLRVLSEGVISAGARAQVLDRPARQVTVAESMRAYYGDARIMRRLLEVEGRSRKWDEIGAAVLSRAGA